MMAAISGEAMMGGAMWQTTRNSLASNSRLCNTADARWFVVFIKYEWSVRGTVRKSAS
jgi:hypothetical protein